MPRDLDWSQVTVNRADLIMRKQVDCSLLESGWTIPVDLHDRLVALNGGAQLAPGENHRVALMVDGHAYEAVLTCVRRPTGPPHMLQIRYDKNHDLRDLLAKVFWSSLSALTVIRHTLKEDQSPGGKVFAEVPPEAAEFVEWKSTSVHYCYELDLAPCRVNLPEPAAAALVRMGEHVSEHMIVESSDDQFSLWLSAIKRLAGPTGKGAAENLSHSRRHLRLAGEMLGSLYGPNCQLCGPRGMVPPEIMVTSIHHIEPFITSLDNRLSNLVMVCPTHHAVLHRAGVQFDHESHSFVIPGSKPLSLILDHHLAS